MLKYICMALAIAAGAVCNAQDRPRLVLMVCVDQLRTDYLEYLEPLMPADGLRRLMHNGVYARNVECPAGRPDRASATSVIVSGTTPDRTGIPSATVWNSTTRSHVPVLHDACVLGNYTDLALSPSALRTGTVTDEVMIDGAGLGLAYAVAADAQASVLMAGHAGTGAVWLDTNTGKWCGSTWYPSLPDAATRRNKGRGLAARLDTMQWKPLLPLQKYPGLPAHKRMYEFRHTFPSSAKDVYEKFAASPKGNAEVTDIAVDILKGQRLGNRGDAVDMLCVGYTAAPFKYVKDGDFRLELEDTYLRLDRDVARLLAAADAAVGLQHCVVMLASTAWYDDAVPDDAKYRLPGGEFSARKAVSLLNAFLASRHGQGNYVDAYAADGIYLNTRLLATHGADEETVAREAREFLLKMSGVSDVYTRSDLLGASSAAEERLRLSLDRTNAPHLVFDFAPGWVVIDDTSYPESRRAVRLARHAAPAMFMAPGLKHINIDAPVPLTALAPTLMGLLHMRVPNGCPTPGLVLPRPE